MGLRVVVIDAFHSDKDGRQQAKVDDLAEFVYDRNENSKTQRQAIRNFTSVDITFVGGDDSLVPWHPRMTWLLAYVNQCMIARSSLFGDKVAARIVWHLACVHGRQLHVVDVLNRGDAATEAADLEDDEFPLAYTGRHSVMLQEVSGEAFQLDDSPLLNNHSDHGSDSGEVTRIKASGVHIRCCNVGMRRRIFGMSVVSGPRDNLKLMQSRGLEKHWLMPKLWNTAGGGLDQRPMNFKCKREWDLNSSLVQARPDVNAVAPLAGLSEQGFLESFAKHTRRHSATIPQPERNVTVLATSQFGPEIVECGRTLTFNFSVKSDSKFIRTLVLEFTRYHAELLWSPGGGLAEQDRRDVSYQFVMQCKPLMDRFHFPPMGGGAEFASQHQQLLRQLQREGILPEAETQMGDTFVNLPKIANSKFERKSLHGRAAAADSRPHVESEDVAKIVHPAFSRALSEEAGTGYAIERATSTEKLSKMNHHWLAPHAPRDSPRAAGGSSGTSPPLAAEKPMVRRMYLSRQPFTNYGKLQRKAEQIDGTAMQEPYTSLYERELQEKNEQRKLWMSPTDFTVVPCTANPPVKPIPPSINLTPWPGDPSAVFQKIVASGHNYPKSEWVSQKGMRFNFSVKSPSEKERKYGGRKMHAVAHRS